MWREGEGKREPAGITLFGQPYPAGGDAGEHNNITESAGSNPAATAQEGVNSV
jgi:hypothetical protein